MLNSTASMENMRVEARVGVTEGCNNRALTCSTGGVDGGLKMLMQQQKARHHQQTQMTTAYQLLAGGVAGAFSKTCTAPLARLTILFQVQGMHGDVAVRSKAGIWKEATRIVNEEGVRAFWKGNLVTIAHRIPYSSVNFYTYEHYKRLLRSLRIPGRSSSDIFIHFLSGGLAGVTAASVTYPLDLIRTRLAVQTNSAYYKGISHTFCTIFRDEGLKGLYKGLGPTLLGVGPNIAIGFSVYEALRSSWFSRRSGDSNVMVSLACGSLSGFAASTMTFPLDLLRRRMQLEGAGGRARVYKDGMWGIVSHVMRTQGFRGFYRGIVPEYYKVVPGVGIAFMTYEILKMLFS